MPKVTFKNEGDTVCCFKIWGDPNMAPVEYAVEPGDTCEVPAGYAGNFMKRRAPQMVKVDPTAPPAPKPEPKPEPEAKAEPKEKKLFKNVGKKKGK